jgi:putative SOS response-associated peptidase YedK
MCGRYTLIVEPKQLIEEFLIDHFPEEFDLRYNIAPTQPVLGVVERSGVRKAGYFQWGLIPSWVKDRKAWKPLINARAETLQEKTSFKSLIHRRRALLLADSFYEWGLANGVKVPFRIMRKDSRPFAFAALWDRHVEGRDEKVTCTILTTEANEFMKSVHHRMPVILITEEERKRWLDVESYTFHDTTDFLQPLANDMLIKYPVRPIVNSPKNDVPLCIERDESVKI